MKEAIEIIWHRWREVAIIVALGVLASLVTPLMRVARQSLPKGGTISSLRIALAAIGITISIIGMLITFGFLRSVVINAFEKRPVRSLISWGKPFFWRLLAVEVLYIASAIGLAYVFFLPFNRAATASGYWVGSFLSPVWWVKGPCWTAAYVLTTVPFILSTASILVRDCPVGQALKDGFNLKLAGLTFAVIVIAATVLRCLVLFVPAEAAAGIAFRIVKIVHAAVAQLANVFVAIFAIRTLAAQMGWSQRPADAL